MYKHELDNISTISDSELEQIIKELDYLTKMFYNERDKRALKEINNNLSDLQI